MAKTVPITINRCGHYCRLAHPDPAEESPIEEVTPPDTATRPDVQTMIEAATPLPDFGSMTTNRPSTAAAREPVDDADLMCPNCVTPWKCNGPHEPTAIDEEAASPEEPPG